jgi:hypothetical protein
VASLTRHSTLLLLKPLKKGDLWKLEGVEAKDCFAAQSVLLVEGPSTLDLTCGARGKPCCSLVEHPTLPLG